MVLLRECVVTEVSEEGGFRNDLRTKRGLSQRAMARKAGTIASVICRLEDADYEGHSLAMLRRIAAALDKRVEIRLAPITKSTRPKSRKVA